MDFFAASLLAMTRGGNRKDVIASRRRSNPSPVLGEAHIEIPPVRIHRLDERDLPRAGAAFDLLLAGDGLVHPFISFVEDQPIAAVAARKAGRQALTVLENALGQVRGDAGIEGSLSAVGEDVDARFARQLVLFRKARRDGLLRFARND